MFALRRTSFPSALWQSQRCAATTAAVPQPNASAVLDFEDHRAVFRHKTTWELVRGLLILRVCSVNAFVDNSLAVSDQRPQFRRHSGLHISWERVIDTLYGDLFVRRKFTEPRKSHFAALYIRLERQEYVVELILAYFHHLSNL